jgi:CBS domain-containing protein
MRLLPRDALPVSERVEDIANKNIISVDENQSVYDAVTLMVTESIGAIVVTSMRRPVGIITERDLAKKIILKGLDPKNVIAKELMSAPLVTIDASASLGEAAQLLQEKKIRRLLVQKNDEIIGIFTQRDLERALLDYFLAISKLE